MLVRCAKHFYRICWKFAGAQSVGDYMRRFAQPLKMKMQSSWSRSMSVTRQTERKQRNHTRKRTSQTRQESKSFGHKIFGTYEIELAPWGDLILNQMIASLVMTFTWVFTAVLLHPSDDSRLGMSSNQFYPIENCHFQQLISAWSKLWDQPCIYPDFCGNHIRACILCCNSNKVNSKSDQRASLLW